MDDFKPPVRNDTPSSDPVDAGPASYEDSETYVTPEGKPTPVTPAATPVKAPKKMPGTKRWLLWRVFLILLLLAMTAAIVAGWFYVQGLYSELDKKDTEITRLQAGTADAASGTQLAGKDFTPQTAIDGVVRDYLEANKTYSGSDANFTNKIRYMDDTFARVDVLEVDQADKNKQTVVATFFLKNVATDADKAADDANQWVLIWSENTLTAADKEELKNTFSVPDDVFTALREE